MELKDTSIGIAPATVLDVAESIQWNWKLPMIVRWKLWLGLRTNPFNGIESFSTVLGSLPRTSIMNPFNGIERHSLQSLPHLLRRFKNPFNGIERTSSLIVYHLPAPVGIHSMELKVLTSYAIPFASPQPNPFNGIESSRRCHTLLSHPHTPWIHSMELKAITWGLPGLVYATSESIQWNWKVVGWIAPYDKLSKPGIHSMELKVETSPQPPLLQVLESIQWNWKMPASSGCL